MSNKPKGVYPLKGAVDLNPIEKAYNIFMRDIISFSNIAYRFSKHIGSKTPKV